LQQRAALHVLYEDATHCRERRKYATVAKKGNLLFTRYHAIKVVILQRAALKRMESKCFSTHLLSKYIEAQLLAWMPRMFEYQARHTPSLTLRRNNIMEVIRYLCSNLLKLESLAFFSAFKPFEKR
jgi:hypothetical protein